jgi:hypothetical protein
LLRILGVLNLLAFLDCPESFHDLAIGRGSLDIELPLFIVLVLRVLLHGLDDAGPAPEEDAHDLEEGLGSVDSKDTKGVPTHLVVHALDKAVEKVVRLVKHNSLAIVFLVVDKVERHGSIVPILPQVMQSLFLVNGIYNESLEVKQVEPVGDLRKLILPGLLLWLSLSS